MDYKTKTTIATTLALAAVGTNCSKPYHPMTGKDEAFVQGLAGDSRYGRSAEDIGDMVLKDPHRPISEQLAERDKAIARQAALTVSAVKDTPEFCKTTPDVGLSHTEVDSLSLTNHTHVGGIDNLKRGEDRTVRYTAHSREADSIKAGFDASVATQRTAVCDERAKKSAAPAKPAARRFSSAPAGLTPITIILQQNANDGAIIVPPGGRGGNGQSR